MPAIRYGRFEWPGLVSPVSGTYTISWGISPGTASIVCLPQDTPIANIGDLIITDDVTTIKIPGCKVDKIRQEHDGDGFVWVVEIFDWRWKWRDLGIVSGTYNQLDEHGKLIPWTIRSPVELAKECFKALGVDRYTINLPPGLTRAQGQEFFSLNPPWIGVIPTTGTNIPINWEAETPAVALDQLCTHFGRVIVPRLSDYTITVALPGFGGPLPDGSIAKRSPSVDDPETPSGVGVVGDPTRYQMRLLLEAVGEEPDGSYRPIDHLSYAPAFGLSNIKQVSTITVTTATPVDTILTVIIEGVTVTHTVTAGQSTADIAISLANAINAGVGVVTLAAIVTASPSAAVVTVTAVVSGDAFSLSASSSNASYPLVAVMTTQPQKKGRRWDLSGPPTFATAQATPNNPNFVITKTHAMELASRSVFKTYRIMDIDVSGGPIRVPGYGKLRRKQQLVISNAQVEQIFPIPADMTLLERRDPNPQGNRDGEPFIVNIYNGYSRDKPAAVYGAVAKHLQQAWHTGAAVGNSEQTDQVIVTFSVDPEKQLVRFSGPVYKLDHNRTFEPKLVLQCAITVRNEDTNELERFKTFRYLAGAKDNTNLVVRKHPDVQLNIIGDYNADEQITGVRILEADPLNRAKYYLDGLEAQYFLTGAEIRDYNGFEPINLDGAVQQVTWQFDRENGCSTTASLNTEHNVYIPPWPARRRAEFLRPPQQEQIAANVQRPRQRGEMHNPFGGEGRLGLWWR